MAKGKTPSTDTSASLGSGDNLPTTGNDAVSTRRRDNPPFNDSDCLRKDNGVRWQFGRSLGMCLNH